MRTQGEEAVCQPPRKALEAYSSLRRGTVDICGQSPQVWPLLGLREKKLSVVEHSAKLLQWGETHSLEHWTQPGPEN